MTTRVLLIGVGPMPTPQAMRIHAPGLRLQAFLETIQEAGCDVALAEFTFGGDTARQFTPRGDVYAHRLVELDLSRTVPQLELWCRQLEPDAVVALTDVGALAATQCGFAGPIYVDYFGDPMAERQQQAAAHGNNASMADAWMHVLPALLRADRFSVCSPSQRLALTGQLGATGRLNAETCGHELVDVIPLALPFEKPLIPLRPKILTEWGVPAGARTIFSSGGFNTWLDEATLFAAVDRALAADPNLHFVATGGSIPGHVEVVFERFHQRTQQSANWSRYHFPGWVSHSDLLDAMMAADVGVNCDLPTLEGELGARNRLLGWAWAGMRLVSTVVAGEPAAGLAEMGFLRPVPFFAPEEMATALVEEARIGRREKLAPVHQALEARWSRRIVTEPIRQWITNPTHAPDHGVPLNPLRELQQNFASFAEQQAMELSIRRKARELGQRLAGNRMAQIAAAMNSETKKLISDLQNL